MPRGKKDEQKQEAKTVRSKQKNTGSTKTKGKTVKKRKSQAAAGNEAKNRCYANEGNERTISSKTDSISKRLREWLEPEKIALIEGWVRNGVTEREIAKNMHCSYSTLRKWKTESSALSAALKKNREIADYIVEGALFKKATGHTVKLQKPMKVKRTEYDPVTFKKTLEYEEIIYVEEEVFVPPDTPAQIFWLKNRCHDKWKDKVEQVIDTEADTAGVVLLAPVLEKNHEPTEESDMGATTQTD